MIYVWTYNMQCMQIIGMYFYSWSCSILVASKVKSSWKNVHENDMLQIGDLNYLFKDHGLI